MNEKKCILIVVPKDAYKCERNNPAININAISGVDDHVRCFACDGGLRKWDPMDDPWTEHCRWFPACPYAIEIKGFDYIELVQASADMDLNVGV